MWDKFKKLIIAIIIPLAVGMLAGLITRNSMEVFSSVEKPPLSPSMTVFPIVWAVLYVLMGIASYLVYREGEENPSEDVSSALRLYAIQLFFNFLWPIAFFTLRWYWFAFAWIMILWVLIIITIVRFGRVSKAAAWLMVPYLLWVTFAAYLNFGVALLN